MTLAEVLHITCTVYSGKCGLGSDILFVHQMDGVMLIGKVHVLPNAGVPRVHVDALFKFVSTSYQQQQAMSTSSTKNVCNGAGGLSPLSGLYETGDLFPLSGLLCLLQKDHISILYKVLAVYQSVPKL